jgi:hypothetical protein
MEPTNTHYLLGIRNTLAERIAPVLSEGDSRRLLGLVLHGVDELLARERGGGEVQNALRDRLRVLVDRGAVLVGAQSIDEDGAWPLRPDVTDAAIRCGWSSQ